MSRARGVGRRWPTIGALILTAGSSTTAFASPLCLSRATVAASALTGWSAPLDRAISIAAPDLSVRDAIDRVAAVSHLQLSYSADLLPANRRTCLEVDRMSTGAVLTELLRGTSLRAIVLDANNVALTPTAGPTAVDREPRMMAGVGQLDRVVVTGTADGAKSRASTFALDVVDGRTLSRGDVSTLPAALDGNVPGLWMWSQAPSSMVGRFGSLRGASSFGVTTPKMYIDGIEVANPLVFTGFDPDRIDRVEVIRGPQGAALYGADAISGVVNIVTRHDGTASGDARWSARTRTGMATSSFTSGALVQDYSLAYRAGTGRKSLGLGVGVGTVGDYIPGGSAKSLLANGDARIVGSRTLLTGMVRVAAKSAGTLTSPVLAGIGQATYETPPHNSSSATGALDSASLLSPFGAPGMRADSARKKQLNDIYGNGAADSNATQSLVQYTVGTTGTWIASPHWTHTLVAGIDGYRLSGLSSQGISVPVATDSIDRLAHTEADRTTFALRSTLRIGSDDAFATSVIVGAEHTATRQEIGAREDIYAGSLSIEPKTAQQPLSYWTNTAGLLSQLNSSWRNTLFLSVGGRAEYSAGAAANSRVNLLPMLGAAYVREGDGQTLKLRAAYGKGIRPSNSVARAATWMSAQSSVAGGRSARLELASLRDLAPEEQAGTEVGADVLFGNGLGVHVTRFDQQATGLIQAVALPSRNRFGPSMNAGAIAYELQNVGAIANRGWELQTTSALGRFSLQGSASFVDSRVQRVATGYSGELRPGDRMLEVPAQTFGVSAAYSTSRWSTSLALARARNWINYDQVAIAERQSAAGFDPKSVTGEYLRNYWREYSGANRLRSTFSYSLTRAWSVMFAGDNLLNIQRGEPDNATVVPGRTLTLGVRTRF